MEIKTFEAFSMKDAVKALKKDFGSDAVILSTKEKPSISGRGKIYEVTAAASGSVKREHQTKAQTDPEIHTYLEAILNRMNHFIDLMPSKATAQSTDAGISEIKLYLMEVLKTKTGSQFEGLSPDLFAVERHLRIMGVSENSITELIKHLQGIPQILKSTMDSQTHQEPTSIREDIKSEAFKWMFKQIRIAPKWNLEANINQLKVIIGPFGAGKSTLIEKLASHFYKREKLPVQVVTLDESRLAGSDQMRIFCKILGIPFHCAKEPSDISTIFKGSGNPHLTLVDTSGFGPRDAESLHKTKSFFGRDLEVEFHMCLSSTEKESYSEQIIKHAMNLGLSSLSFTKLDQTPTYGELFNLTKRWSIPLGFFTYGNGIPTDIERASKERVIERIFGI
jgi:flagellar biosynthesis protein FlhF